KDWIAALVTGMFCLAPLTWKYAIEAEVFALNNLFAVLLLLAFYEIFERRSIGWLYFASGLFGLACGDHLTIVVFALPIWVLLLWREHRLLLRPRVLLACASLFLLGLTPYLWLFYLGKNRALFAWGDFSTWNGFWTHVLRREYGTFSL